MNKLTFLESTASHIIFYPSVKSSLLEETKVRVSHVVEIHFGVHSFVVLLYADVSVGYDFVV